MAIYQAPAMILVPALLINVALCARAAWAHRAPATSGDATAPVASHRAAAALTPLLIALALLAGALERRYATAGGRP